MSNSREIVNYIVIHLNPCRKNGCSFLDYAVTLSRDTEYKKTSAQAVPPAFPNNSVTKK